MPRSPKPSSPEGAYSLQLVPSEALTERLEWALGYLRRELGPSLGAYLEFGVYNGASMTCMLEALRRQGDRDTRLFGFDSFQGLPPSAATEDGGVWHAGQFRCPKSLAEERIAAASDRPGRVTLVEGWFADTLAAGDIYGIGRASIALIDSDTYSSAREALRFLAPLLTNPSIVMFDDWKLNDLDVKAMGEYRAFYEWEALYPDLEWEKVQSYNRKSRTFILRRNASNA